VGRGVGFWRLVGVSVGARAPWRVLGEEKCHSQQ